MNIEERIKAATEKYNGLVEKRNAAMKDAEKADTVEAMKEQRSILSGINGEINSSKKELDELQALKKEMAQTRSLIAPTDKHHEPADKVKEIRSAINTFLHKKVIDRDALSGLVSSDAEVTIPKAIQYVPEKEVKTVVDLAKFANHFKATTASGTYPILKRATTGFNTVEELAKNPELAKPDFEQVDWKVNTYRGALPISRESIDDSAADLTGIVSQNIFEQKINTTNGVMATIMKSFTAKDVTDLDAVKQIINVDLDPAYNKVIIASATFYQWMDTLKDGDGRYLLMPSITEGSPSRLLGMPVYVVSDDLLGKAGEAHAFIGDIKRGVLWADRLDIMVRWADNEYFGQYLQGVIRFGAVKADGNAGYFLSNSAFPAVPKP